MKHSAIILFLGLSVFLPACSRMAEPTKLEAPPTQIQRGGFGFDGKALQPRNVRYSDLSPATIATVSNDTVTIHLGSDTNLFGLRTLTDTKIEGGTVYIEGWAVLDVQFRDVTVKLSSSVRPESVAVIWVEPDGRDVAVPITK